MWNLFVIVFAACFSAAVWWCGMHWQWPYIIGFVMGGFCGFGASDLIREDRKEQQEQRPPGEAPNQ